MMSARMAAISCVIGAIATISAIAMIISSSVEASMDIRDIQTNEHADGVNVLSELPSTEMQNGTIYLNGYWGKSTVDVSFFSSGLTASEFDEVTESLYSSLDTIDARQINGTEYPYENWPHLLGIMSMHSKSVPALKVVEPGSNGANIKVFLHTDSHPEGKVGAAKIGRDKATFEILFTEIHIYSAYDLYEDGYVKSVFAHELGHALGLGHASLETSIMHSPLIVLNDTVYAGIRNCEFDAASSLYVDVNIDAIPCSN